MTSLIKAVTLIGAAAFVSQAATAERIIVPLGFGSRPCMDWTSFRSAGGERDAQARQWVFGFFSGINAFGPQGRSLFFPYDEKDLIDFLDKNCRLVPKRTVASTADYLVRGLLKTERRFKKLRHDRHQG